MSLYTPTAPPRQYPDPAPAPRPRGVRFGWVKAALVVLVFIGVVAVFVVMDFGTSWTDARMMGAPLRVPTPNGDRVFLLTGQWRTVVITTGRTVHSTSRTTDLLVDLWEFDEQARPLSRVRMRKERDGAMADGAILGAAGDTVWIFLKGELLGWSIANAKVVADPARIEAANPALRGLLPAEERYYELDGAGLVFLGLDGRHWRIDSNTLAATEAGNTPAPAVPGAVAPAYFTPYSTASFQSRGMELPEFWLGLLSAEESKKFDQINRTSHLGGMTRHSLWQAKAKQVENFFGQQTEYGDPVPLPSSPEFLSCGLLAMPQRSGPSQVLWAKEPDSVFVLYMDKLGETGKLRLCRIAGPVGNVLWDVPLHLSVLQSVMPGEKSILLYGCEFTPAPDANPRDPMHTAVQRLVAVDIPSGTVSVHDQGNVSGHPEAAPLPDGA